MEPALEPALNVHGLTKAYPGFLLDHVSFSVPSGSIVGLIGENGAGKSTTLSCILGLAKSDAGRIEILGQEDRYDGAACRQNLGVVFDGDNFPKTYTPKKLRGLMSKLYPRWEDATFFELLNKFALPENKRIQKFSKGMKAKLALAV
ncbi:MAG: ATP-binding cassette domain-containing protein, partial [Gemmiger sp.]|nr:ATP-binding cassette domain-containing protein [Gemmiger sp.]